MWRGNAQRGVRTSEYQSVTRAARRRQRLAVIGRVPGNHRSMKASAMQGCVHHTLRSCPGPGTLHRGFTPSAATSACIRPSLLLPLYCHPQPRRTTTEPFSSRRGPGVNQSTENVKARSDATITQHLAEKSDSGLEASSHRGQRNTVKVADVSTVDTFHRTTSLRDTSQPSVLKSRLLSFRSRIYTLTRLISRRRTTRLSARDHQLKSRLVIVINSITEKKMDAPLSSPTLNGPPQHNYFSQQSSSSSSTAQSTGPTSAPQTQSQQQSYQPPPPPQRPNDTTSPFLRDFNLVAEAAKRAQMAVLVRDLEGVAI